MKRFDSPRARFGLALGLSSSVSVGFWIAGVVSNHAWDYWYLVWNLFLAWIPLGLSLWLEAMLRLKLWSSWQPLVLTFLWFVFLPNSFYVISDFVHLQEVPRVDIVFDVIMLSIFGVNGLILGYVSLYMVHRQLRQRLRRSRPELLVAAILFLSSFAMYIGRELRWNTWDVLINPIGLIVDVTNRLVGVLEHTRLVSTTVGFFVVLGTLYVVLLSAIELIRSDRRRD